MLFESLCNSPSSPPAGSRDPICPTLPPYHPIPQTHHACCWSEKSHKSLFLYFVWFRKVEDSHQGPWAQKLKHWEELAEAVAGIQVVMYMTMWAQEGAWPSSLEGVDLVPGRNFREQWLGSQPPYQSPTCRSSPINGLLYPLPLVSLSLPDSPAPFLMTPFQWQP